MNSSGKENSADVRNGQEDIIKEEEEDIPKGIKKKNFNPKLSVENAVEFIL